MLTLPTLGGFMLVALWWVISLWSLRKNKMFMLVVPSSSPQDAAVCYISIYYMQCLLHKSGATFVLFVSPKTSLVQLQICIFPAGWVVYSWGVSSSSPSPISSPHTCAPLHHILLFKSFAVVPSLHLSITCPCVSHKCFILFRIMTCYCYVYKPTAALCKDTQK